MAVAQAEDPALNEAIQAVDKLYSEGSVKWFDYLGADAVVYSVGSIEPFRGKDAYRKHFEKMLTSHKRTVNVLTRNVQQFGDKAVVAQSVSITQEDVVANIRQSIVWQRDKDRWHMDHVHTSMFGSPSASGTAPKDIAGVRVLNERIATVAAVLGVAQ